MSQCLIPLWRQLCFHQLGKSDRKRALWKDKIVTNVEWFPGLKQGHFGGNMYVCLYWCAGRFWICSAFILFKGGQICLVKAEEGLLHGFWSGKINQYCLLTASIWGTKICPVQYIPHISPKERTCFPFLLWDAEWRYLWTGSRLSAASGWAWPPCSCAGEWSGSRARSGSAGSAPGTSPPALPGRWCSVSAHQSPAQTRGWGPRRLRRMLGWCRKISSVVCHTHNSSSPLPGLNSREIHKFPVRKQTWFQK